MKKEAKKRPFSGAAGRTCSFSGDAPLRRYQRRPLPNKETGVLRRRAKRFVPTKRLPPSSPSRIHIIIQNPDFSTRIRGFVVPLAGLEPARSLNRGILSPLRLPIPPQRHIFNLKNNSAPERCRVFFWRRHPDLNWG